VAVPFQKVRGSLSTTPPTGAMPPIQMVVVVPARNEEDYLPRCLATVDKARNMLNTATRAPVSVRVVVVADRCTDRTAAIAGQWAGVEMIRTDPGSVGSARASGATYAFALADASPEQVWMACTDADSAVPADWLTVHYRAAIEGTDPLLGTVRPDQSELSPHPYQQWLGLHEVSDGHGHGHGANLGIRLSTYRDAGGFPAVEIHEDALLTQRVAALGAMITRTGLAPVITSARTVGRTPGGMAGYLAHLPATPDLLSQP